MKRGVFFGVSFVWLTLFALQLYAEPGATTRALIDDKLSMLDWGIYNLEKEIGTIEINQLTSAIDNGKTIPLASVLNPVTTIVYFDWDTDRVFIKGSIKSNYGFCKSEGTFYKTTEGNPCRLRYPFTKSDAVELCNDYVNQVRKRIGAVAIGATEAKPEMTPDNAAFLLQAYFSHSGYSTQGHEKRLAALVRQIRVIGEIDGAVYNEGANPLDKDVEMFRVSCRANLFEPDVFISTSQ